MYSKIKILVFVILILNLKVNAFFTFNLPSNGNSILRNGNKSNTRNSGQVFNDETSGHVINGENCGIVTNNGVRVNPEKNEEKKTEKATKKEDQQNQTLDKKKEDQQNQSADKKKKEEEEKKDQLKDNKVSNKKDSDSKATKITTNTNVYTSVAKLSSKRDKAIKKQENKLNQIAERLNMYANN